MSSVFKRPDYYDRQKAIAHLRDFARFWTQERIQQWRDDNIKNQEKQYAQQFWSDLLGSFGIIPERISLFERNAERTSTGRNGYIDFFMSGIAIGEAKSLGENLDAAEDQLFDYLDSISQNEYPKYGMVSDFERIRIIRLDGSEPKVELLTRDIADYYDSFVFLIGKESVSRQEQEEASIVAADLMAELYTSFLGDDTDIPVGEDAPKDAEEEDERVQQTSILMTRLLFLLYGDDAGLWPADLFHRWVEQETTSSSLGPQLNQLFQVLNTPPALRSHRMSDLMAQFPYVNGGIFKDSLDAEFFTEESREALLDACRFQWNRISVAIFGAMFQLVKSKEARRAAGEHYTSEKNILKTLEPLFLSEFREEADRLIRNKSTSLKDFDNFLNNLSTHVFCDPACGGGNFLNLTYAKLREIETDVLVEKRNRGGEFTASLDISIDQRLSINQFYGFEINWWAAKIAETAMFLVDHQANLRLAQALGDAPNRLPIEIAAHIIHDNALRLDWKKAIPEPKGKTYIFGNPPFIGARLMSKAQKAELTEAWGNAKGVKNLDYVTGWHIKTLDLLRDRVGEFAFVTTNSIAQGQSVPLLFGTIFHEGWHIKYAHQTFAWDSEAPGQAAVHCVIIGFTRKRSTKPQLFSYETPKGEPQEKTVSQINAYLVEGPNVLVREQKTPLSPVITPAIFGSMANDGGHLVVKKQDYAVVAADPIAAKYLRPFYGSEELLHDKERWCLWLEDLSASELTKSSILNERVNACQTHRSSSTRAATRKLAEYPTLFGEPRQPRNDYLGVPKVVSENRKYFIAQPMSSNVIASDLLFTVNDQSGVAFALISSSMFITWQKTVGGRLKSDYRFANTVTWNTFPVPNLDEKTRQKIIAAGQKVLEARALQPGVSLADQYNPRVMKRELRKAHDALDSVVDKAFGASRKLTTESQRLEFLFRHYLELTQRQG